MRLESFFENFELLAEAQGGVQKLRELVLQLAVQGKLVAQDPRDEPAQALLTKIEQVKEELVRAKSIAKPRKLPRITAEELPHDIPLSWTWVRLSDVFDVRDGTHDSPKYLPEGIPLVTSKNISSASLDLGDVKYISLQDHEKISERSKVDRNDILFAMIGSIGNPVIVDTDEEFSIKNVALFKYFSAPLSISRYLHLFLIHATAKMKEESSGGVQSFVSLGYLRKYPFPLPPLEEQKRIVAKVDELMALCDKLEQRQRKRNEARGRLNKASLNALTTSESGPDFNTHWRRITKNFHHLYTSREAVNELRQAILQLAVQGKLVPQDPNDEPAEVLLERVKDTRQSRARDKLKSYPDIDKDTLPWKLPTGWIMERLGNIVTDFQNGISKRQAQTGNPTPVVRLADINGDRVSEADLREIPLTKSETEQYQLNYGDILAIRVNGSASLVGRFVLCVQKRPWAYSDHLIRVRLPQELVAPRWVALYGNSPTSRAYFESKFITTAGQKTVNQNHLGSMLIAIPPYEEQKRIVAKVDQLMTLCDELEAKLERADSDSQKLVEAVVHWLEVA